MPFTHPVPDWNAQGAEPPESLRTNGWQINQKPPADYFNWFFYNSAKAIIELQLEAVNIDQKGVPDGLATLGADGKVPASQLNVSAPPDATITAKGVVQLSNSTTSTSEELAATPKAVKDAKDGLSTQIGILSDSVVPYGTASGTNAKTISITDGFATLKTGLALAFKNTSANTGAVTLNVNGLGAKSVVKSGGTALSSGNLKAGGVYTVRYDGSNFILQGEGGEYGNAQPSDVRQGTIFGTENGLQTGTMLPDPLATFQVGTTNLYYVGQNSRQASLNQQQQKLFSAKMKRSGSIRLSFQTYNNGGYGTTYVKRNGSNISSYQNQSTYVGNTLDITVSVNDVIEIWSISNTSSGFYSSVREIKFTTIDPMYITEIS